jgi:CRP/FNR family cyclic AMP-dependent transcriptional regulator
MAKIKPLQKSPIFSSLSDHELALFSRIVNEEDYTNGTVLVAENMKSDRFFLIERGKIALRTGGPGEGEDLILEQGDTLGEWAIIAPPHLTSVSARVVEEAQVLVLERGDFDRFAEEEPLIALKIVGGIVKSLWPSLQSVGKLLKESL